MLRSSHRKGRTRKFGLELSSGHHLGNVTWRLHRVHQGKGKGITLLRVIPGHQTIPLSWSFCPLQLCFMEGQKLSNSSPGEPKEQRAGGEGAGVSLLTTPSPRPWDPKNSLGQAWPPHTKASKGRRRQSCAEQGLLVVLWEARERPCDFLAPRVMNGELRMRTEFQQIITQINT